MIGTVDLDGFSKGIIFEASHPDNSATLFWHVDNQYLGETKGQHSLKYIPEEGQHLLTVLDEFGNQKKILFTILGISVAQQCNCSATLILKLLNL